MMGDTTRRGTSINTASVIVNADGHPPTLRAAQPGNRNAVKVGIYSSRVRAERADEIRAAATGTSTLALALAAVRDELPRLRRLREALEDDVAARGPSTRAGAPRAQLSQRSSVAQHLAKLEAAVERAEPVDRVDYGSEDDPASSLRAEVLASLVLQDLLDHDLEHRGVSTTRGGERRHVAQRIQVSRDLVRLADRVRIEVRRAARSGAAPMGTWDVAREIAFDPSQPPSEVIAAVKFLLTHHAPRVISPELERWEEEVRAMSPEEIDAAIRELEAHDSEHRANAGPDADMAADTQDDPEASEAPGTEVIARCLAILQRIGDGVDSRASARDRMCAAELREQHLPASPRSALEDEIESMTPEEVRELYEDLVDEDTV